MSETITAIDSPTQADPRIAHAPTLMTTLSPQQKRILLHLLAWHEAIQDHRSRNHFLAWDTPYGTEGSRSDHASMSRSLIRLERRGLLLRQNWVNGSPAGGIRTCMNDPHKRTTNVKLLPIGLEIARRLTTSTSEKC